MRKILFVVVAAAVALGLMSQRTLQAQDARAAEAQLKAAQYKADVQGDLKGAIDAYQRIVTTFSRTNRAAAATALLRAAECHQRLGDAEARKMYEQIVREFPDQKETVLQAQSHLNSTSVPATPPKLAERLVWTQRSDEPGSITSMSADGRTAVMIRTSVDGVDDIGIRDMATGQVRWLGVADSTDHDIYSARLSPDLRQVVYTDDLNDTELRVIGTEPGARPRVLVGNNPGITDFDNTAWSPDARSVVTAIQRKDKTWQIGRVSIADGSVTVLKSLEWRFRQIPDRDGLSLSPDGRYIAYSALTTNPTKAPPALPDSADRKIYLLAADGSSETELVKAPGGNTKPTWTADGSHILFQSNQPGAAGLWAVAVAAGHAAGGPFLVKADFDGTVMPTQSGTCFVVTSSTVQNVSIVEAPLNGPPGTQVQPRVTETLEGGGPVWSPDGKFIAMARNDAAGGGPGRLIVHSLETGEDRWYAHDIAIGPRLWVHGSTALVVAGHRRTEPVGSPDSLYRVDVKSGDLREILPLDPVRFRAALIGLSPDDKTVYVLAHQPSEVVYDRVVAIDLTTKQETLAIAFPSTFVPVFRGALSPDGRLFAVVHRTGLARVAIDGSDQRDLHPVMATGGSGVVAWSRDGRTIYFATSAPAERSQKLMRISADGGKAEFTGIEFAGNGGPFSLSPDGGRIAYGSIARTQQLWALDNLQAVLRAQR